MQRVVSRVLLQPAVSRHFGGAARGFASRSSAASLSMSERMVKVLKSEVAQEREQYEQPAFLQQFLKDNVDWKLVDTDGDVNLKLSREVGGKQVTVEWQLVSPFNPSMQQYEEGQESGEAMEDQSAGSESVESTDFTITVTDLSVADRGLIFYCSTAAGEGEHEYVIGNVRSFSSAAERDSVNAYNGPDFEDLNEEVQQGLDEYLASLGINEQVRLFVDTAAIDKEQREYNRWLSSLLAFFSTKH